MSSNVRWSAGELVPLADRLRYMFMVRVAIIGGIALGALLSPGLVGRLPAHAPAVLAGWVGVSLGAEVAWRAWRRRGLPLFGATLILDGAILVWLSQVGTVTNVRYLIFLHLVAVVLLASYRSGLKMVLWYTLLMFTVFFAARDNAMGLGRTSPGLLSHWDVGQLSVFVGAMWAVAVATAGFSAVNERELRRRRFDLEALARFAVALEDAGDRKTVADALFAALGDAFPVDRLVLLGSGRRPAVLAHRGVDTAVVGNPVFGPDSVVSRAQADRETLLLAGFDRDADPWLNGALGGVGHFIVIPLFAEGGCVGILLAEHSSRGGSRVERRLVSILERFASHTALALRNATLLEEMARMANTDGLTHIANRRTFEANLEKEMARSIRSGDPVSLIMLDIDKFKVLNDTHGHQTGDQVLREVAVALQATGREFDTVARYGGEEFAVILPACGPADALTAALRLHRLVREGVTSVPITVSVGVASFPVHAQTGQGLVKTADDALYEAKRAGRNRVRSADATVEMLASPGTDG